MSEKIIFKKEYTQDDFATERVDVIKNALLGDYNQNGHYVISDKIITELINMKKIKKNSYGNSVFCIPYSSNIGEVNFEILFKKNSKLNIAVAELYVLEIVEKINGYILNTIKTPIAKFSEEISDGFVSRTYLAFNVVDIEGGQEIEDVNTVFIDARKLFLNMVNDLTDTEYESAFEIYFNKRIGLLKSGSSVYCNEVLDKFNKEYNKIEKYFLVDKKGKIQYKVLNDLLDKSFEDINGINEEYEEDEKKYKKRISAFMISFVNNIKTIEEKAEVNVVNKNSKHKNALANVASDRKDNYLKDGHAVIETNPKKVAKVKERDKEEKETVSSDSVKKDSASTSKSSSAKTPSQFSQAFMAGLTSAGTSAIKGTANTQRRSGEQNKSGVMTADATQTRQDKSSLLRQNAEQTEKVQALPRKETTIAEQIITDAQKKRSTENVKSSIVEKTMVKEKSAIPVIEINPQIKKEKPEIVIVEQKTQYAVPTSEAIDIFEVDRTIIAKREKNETTVTVVDEVTRREIPHGGRVLLEDGREL